MQKIEWDKRHKEWRSSIFNWTGVKWDKKKVKNAPEENPPKIETNDKIIDIVESILYFNQLNQSGKGLKILTPR